LPADYPPLKKLEIAITGRSNAGKSSFINALTNNKIAKVSSTPGKTRLLNFFDVGDHYTLVDMPGYGFASRSGSEVVEWKTMIESYFLQRSTLRGLLLVMDIRREWDEEEELLLQFAGQIGFPVAVILTKSDKVGRGEMLKAQKQIKADAQTDHVFVVSSLKKTGTEAVEEFIFENWIKPEVKS